MLRDRLFKPRKASAFTLQWHLTNACPFHCRHCYDRSERDELPLSEATRVISDLLSFCATKKIQPRISLTGGDPLLYPHFWELYQAITAKQIHVSILGNPISEETIKEIVAVHKPVYYQVSLEGLREHNDAIRGKGHYDQTLVFLATARRYRIRTHVMLTLTRDNVGEVFALSEEISTLASKFSFNRLASVGEAASMELPEKKEFETFLESYVAARKGNPTIRLKENLTNIILHRLRRPLSGGCTGFGCGAAFNFVALLPDGDVYACRKWPSLIGDIKRASLAEIYDSAEAKRHRKGATACKRCRLRRVCGGCPAVTYSCGLDPFEDRDPYCFLCSG